MNALEMQLEFDTLVSQLSVYSGYRFMSHETESFLNSSQETWVERQYSSIDGRRDKFFESNEKSRRELNELINNYSATAGQFSTGSSALHSNAVFVELPTDFLYTLKEECTISYTDCNDDTATKSVKVKPVTHDEYLMDIDNPFKKPGKEVIWRMDYQSDETGSKNHELIGDALVTITNYSTRYIKRPQIIVLSSNIPCELDQSVHREIVRGAVNMAHESLKSRQLLMQVKSPVE